MIFNTFTKNTQEILGSPEVSVESVRSAKQMVQEMKNSQDVVFDWPDTKQEPLKETISTDEGGKDFVQKVTYDAYRGRENVALVYGALYTEDTDPNYPESIVEKTMGPVEVVFVRVIENEGVRFGRIAPGEEVTVRFYTYAAGLEVTEDMVEYNKTWEITDMSIGMGESYNKLLNHLHMSPIIQGSFTTTGGGLAAQKDAQKDGTAQEIAFATDIKTTLLNALTVMPRGSILVANSFDRNRIENAIVTSNLDDDTTPNVVRRTLSPENIVYYDGDEVTVGDKVYEYEGVTAGEAYIVAPKRGLRSRIKHDLRMKSIAENPKILTAGGIVGVTRRAVYAQLGGEFGVMKVNLE